MYQICEIILSNPNDINFDIAIMQLPQLTVQNSNRWKLWHAFNYSVGGGTFLVGSILLFPIFANYMDAAQVSGWLYSIGSATFLFADVTEWLHYVYKDCRFKIYAINYFVNAVGSFLYLVGSICFIPEVNQLDLGLNLFIWGSALIVFSQTWKLIRSLNQRDKSCTQCYREDPSGFRVDLFAGIGGLLYLCGTFVFQKVSQNADLTDWAALIYSIGGFCFFISVLFLHKRYFWQDGPQNSYIKTGNSIVTSEI